VHYIEKEEGPGGDGAWKGGEEGVENRRSPRAARKLLRTRESHVLLGMKELKEAFSHRQSLMGLRYGILVARRGVASP